MLKAIWKAIAGLFGRRRADARRDARGRFMPPKPPAPSGYPEPPTFRFHGAMRLDADVEGNCPHCDETIKWPQFDNPRLVTVGACPCCGHALTFRGASLRSATNAEIDMLRQVNPEFWRGAEARQRQWRERVLPFDAPAQLHTGGQR